MKIQFTTKKLMLVALALVISFTSVFASSPRKVLMEEATNASCPPCAAYNPAYQKYISENLGDLVPLVYHWDFPGKTDPMFLDDVAMQNGRIESYYGINSVPMGIVNGDFKRNLSTTSSDLKAQAASYKGSTSPITIKIVETKTGSSVSIKVTVSSDEAISGKKLRVAATEYLHNYTDAGNNGETEFFWLARKMFPTHAGSDLTLAAGESKDFTFNYTIKSGWNADQMYVVAFVQDDATKNVLQAEHSMKMVRAEFLAIDGRFLKVDKGITTQKKVTVKNPNDAQTQFNLTVDAPTSYFETGWSATVSPASVTLAPGATQEVTVSLKAGSNAGFAQVSVKATPKTTDLSAPATTMFFALSNGVKYIYYYGQNAASNLNYSLFKAQTAIAADATMIPLSEETLAAYPAQDFELVFFDFDMDARGVFSSSGSIGSAIMSTINDLISKDKKILISSAVDLAFAFGPNGSYEAQQFYTDILGLKNVSPSIVVTADGSQIYKFTATGIMNDEISTGLSMSMNEYSQSHPYYTFYHDNLIPETGSKAVKYLTYKADSAAAVRVMKGNAKIAYMSFGFEQITSQQTASTLLGKTITWLLKTGDAPQPAVTLSATSMDFGKTKSATTVTKDFSITNSGKGDLVISKIEITGVDKDAYAVVMSGESLPATVLPGAKYEFQIEFTAEADLQADKNYQADMIITTNVSKPSDYTVPLNGIGQGTLSVNDGTIESIGFTMTAQPNSFSSETTVKLNLSGSISQNVQIVLVDNLGNVVAKIMNDNMAPGSYDKTLSASNLASGTYFIQAIVNNKMTQIPVVITK